MAPGVLRSLVVLIGLSLPCWSCSAGTDQLSASGGSAGAAASKTGAAGNPGSSGAPALLGGAGPGDGGPAIGALAITPANPVIDVTYADGALSGVTIDGTAASSTIDFKATMDGVAADAHWSIDRGEIGTIDPATGALTPKTAIAALRRSGRARARARGRPRSQSAFTRPRTAAGGGYECINGRCTGPSKPIIK